MSKNNSPDPADHVSEHEPHTAVPQDVIPADSLQDKFLILAGVACLAGLLFVIVQWGGIQLPEVHEGGEPATQTAPKSSQASVKSSEIKQVEVRPELAPGTNLGSTKSSEVTPAAEGQNASGTQAPTAAETVPPPENTTEKPVPMANPNEGPTATPGSPPPPAQTQPAIPAQAPGQPPPAQGENSH